MNYSIFMSPTSTKWIAAIGLTIVMLVSPGIALGQAGLKTYTGTFPDQATYLIEVPHGWNGTLFLYSHGYVLRTRRIRPRTVATCLFGCTS